MGGSEPWRGTSAADLLSRALLGGGFLVTALALAATTGPVTSNQWVALALLVGLYAVAYRTEYRHVVSSTVPTEPVLVAMLFLLPPQLVPLAVTAGELLGGGRLRFSNGNLAREVAVRLLNGWHCIGPVVVFLVVQPGPPDLADWPVYLLALAAQFVFDVGTGVMREYALGRTSQLVARPMLWTLGVDAVLAVVGLCAVIAAHASLITVALVAAPVALVALLIQDRRELAEKREDLGRAVQTAREEARVDALTGVGNRRAWLEAITAAELQLLSQPDWQATVIVADLDNLKLANDAYGHEVGDELIRALARVAAAVAPTGSILCRTGGDEFAMLATGPTGTYDMSALLNEMTSAVAAQPAVCGIQPSAAICGAQHPPHPTIADAIRAADADIFLDKRQRQVARSASRALPVQRPDTTDLLVGRHSEAKPAG